MTRGAVRNGLIVTGGNLVSALATLARTLWIAVLVPVDQFGIAAVLLLVVGLVEMASQLGVQQIVVQDARGDEPGFLAALHLMQAWRGVLGALVLLALAVPLAGLAGAPQSLDLFLWLALVPLANGLVNLDAQRRQRARDFGGTAWLQILGGLASLAVIPIAALFARDASLMLVSVLAQALTILAASHLLAKRRTRFRRDVQIRRDVWRFGTPLLVNGALLFLIFQGERIIATLRFGLADLAILSLGVTLTLTPTLILARSLQSLFLPALSRAKGAAFLALRRRLGLAVGLSAVGFAAGGALLGPVLVRLGLPSAYQPLAGLIGLMALQQAIRLLKTTPATTALALGQTASPMFANLLRAAFLPLAFVLAAKGLHSLILVGIAGECAALALALFLQRRGQIRSAASSAPASHPSAQPA